MLQREIQGVDSFHFPRFRGSRHFTSNVDAIRDARRATHRRAGEVMPAQYWHRKVQFQTPGDPGKCDWNDRGSIRTRFVRVTRVLCWFLCKKERWLILGWNMFFLLKTMVDSWLPVASIYMISTWFCKGEPKGSLGQSQEMDRFSILRSTHAWVCLFWGPPPFLLATVAWVICPWVLTTTKHPAPSSMARRRNRKAAGFVSELGSLMIDPRVLFEPTHSQLFSGISGFLFGRCPAKRG